MTSILLTGSEGLIGSQILRYFNMKDLHIATLDVLPGHGEHTQIDILDENLRYVLEKYRPTTIIHTAAQTSVPFSISNPERDLEVNGLGTLKLLQLGLEHGCSNFIYLASGGAIYDSNNSMPTSESDREFPVSPYGLSKNLGESYVRILTEGTNCTWTSLALSNVYAHPSLNTKGVIYEFWKAISNDLTPKIHGAEVTRDFVHVDDVVEAVIKAINAPTNCRTNISSGIEVSLMELFNIMVKVLGKDVVPQIGDVLPGDVKRSCLDNSLAHELLGWSPKIGIEEGLRNFTTPYLN
jgi:UDP-glucose 4-epimerase